MKYFFFLVVLAFVPCLGCGTEKADNSLLSSGKPSDPEELAKLKGKWEVVAIEKAGTKVPQEEVEKQKLAYEFDGEKVIIHGERTIESGLNVDGSTNPKRMTIRQQMAIRAVYSIEGNKMRLCYGTMQDFPSEIASKESTKTDLYILEKR